MHDLHSTQNVTVENNGVRPHHRPHLLPGDRRRGDINYQGNLGLGAMSHNFDVHDAPTKTAKP